MEYVEVVLPGNIDQVGGDALGEARDSQALEGGRLGGGGGGGGGLCVMAFLHQLQHDLTEHGKSVQRMRRWWGGVCGGGASRPHR